ncbi:MAG TPA: hypothetical protein VK498_08635 [Ferruginibacter sp.]|nr:hypothetical protein [Ferruginibacter sp.]
MPFNIKIDEDLVQEISQPLNNRLEKIYSEIDDHSAEIEKLTQKADGIKYLLAQLDFGGTPDNEEKFQLSQVRVLTNGYNAKWGWSQKVKYIVEKENKPITSSEVAQKILKFEPTLDKVTALKNVSADLGKLASGHNQILTREKEGKGFVYKLIKKPVEEQPA